MSLNSLARPLGAFWLLISVSSALPAWGVGPQEPEPSVEVPVVGLNLLSREVSALSFVLASDGEHVLVSDLSKRISRIALPEGDVVAESVTVMGDDPCLLFELGERVLALGRSSMAVIDEETLEVVASRQLEAALYFPRATSPLGDAFVTGKHGVWEIHRLMEDGDGYTLGVQPLPKLVAAAFSPDGRRLALATGTEVRVVDSRTLEAVGDDDVSTFGPMPSTILRVAFYGNDRLVVGWGQWGAGEEKKAPGVLVHDLRGGAPPQRLDCPSPRGLGGRVSSIYCDPERQLLVLGHAPAGLLAGFRLVDDKWEKAYVVDYGSGRWGALTVRRGPKAAEGFVSGMTPQHSSVIHLESGEVLLRRQAEGMARLEGASQGRLLVGMRHGRLVVRAR